MPEEAIDPQVVALFLAFAMTPDHGEVIKSAYNAVPRDNHTLAAYGIDLANDSVQSALPALIAAQANNAFTSSANAWGVMLTQKFVTAVGGTYPGSGCISQDQIAGIARSNPPAGPIMVPR
jgi:hypothetical protein